MRLYRAPVDFHWADKFIFDSRTPPLRDDLSGRIFGYAHHEFAEILALQQPHESFRRVFETVDEILTIF